MKSIGKPCTEKLYARFDNGGQVSYDPKINSCKKAGPVPGPALRLVLYLLNR